MSIRDAAFEACKERLRPILMTVFTMIAGMIPLIIEGGAGANGNRALALGVVGGMSVGTIALLFVVPVFFIVFQKLHEKYQGGRGQSSESTDGLIVADEDEVKVAVAPIEEISEEIKPEEIN